MTTIPQRENKHLLDTIDEVVINSATWATELQAWMVDRKGAYLPLFMEFYKAFTTLVRLTGDLTEMEKQGELVKKCREWCNLKGVDLSPNIATMARIESGIALYDEYYHQLNHSGLITIRK